MFTYTIDFDTLEMTLTTDKVEIDFRSDAVRRARSLAPDVLEAHGAIGDVIGLTVDYSNFVRFDGDGDDNEVLTLSKYVLCSFGGPLPKRGSKAHKERTAAHMKSVRRVEAARNVQVITIPNTGGDWDDTTWAADVLNATRSII